MGLVTERPNKGQFGEPFPLKQVPAAHGRQDRSQDNGRKTQQHEAVFLPDNWSCPQDNTKESIRNLTGTETHSAHCGPLPSFFSRWGWSRCFLTGPAEASDLHLAQKLPCASEGFLLFSPDNLLSPPPWGPALSGDPLSVPSHTSHHPRGGAARRISIIRLQLNLTLLYVVRQPHAMCFLFRDIFALLFSTEDLLGRKQRLPGA